MAFDAGGTLQGPPNFAAILNAAANLGKMTEGFGSSLGDAYNQGQQQQYQQRNQNLFANGMPTDANGNPDYNAMIKKMVQAGGAPAASGALPLLQAQAGSQVANAAFGGSGSGGQPQNAGPATSTAASGPANITGSYGNGQPKVAADTAGADTLNSLAAEHHVDLDAFLTKYPGAKGLLNRDLTSSQAQAIGQRMSAMGAGGVSGTPVLQAIPAPQQDENSTNSGTPVGVGGSSPISPAPTSASGNIGGAPRHVLRGTVTPDPAKMQDRAPQVAQAPVQTGMPSAEEIQRYETSGNNKLRAATSPVVSAQQATALRDAGNKDLEIAKQLREQRQKYLEPTTEQKNLTSGAAARTEEQKGEIASGQKEFDAINKLGTEARVANQKVQLAKSFLNSDDYYAGPFEATNRRIKQFTASFGGDPNAANSQEAFNKAINDLLSEQIRAMAGSGVGRVLMTEVQTMKDSIASQKMTPATNRLLIEEIDRVHRAQSEIQDAAAQYVESHGHLDAGFQKIVAKYYRENPLFSENELHDPRLIAPPVAPPGMNAAQAQTWAQRRGLKSGDPIKTQDGRVMWMP